MSAFTRSPWVVHYDATSCNGCDIEVVAALTPIYDAERFGVINTGNPKHADIFLVTGSVNEQSRKVVENIYEQMPDPKVVVAVGICATSGCVFREAYNVYGGVDTVIPVDIYVPGCAARPESIIDGIIKAVGVLEKKHEMLKGVKGISGKLVIERAAAEDAPEILALQKIVYQNEAEIYNDFDLAPLKQSLQDLVREFDTTVFLKAVANGKIIGSVRARKDGDTAHIGRLVVHPYFWRRGLGTRMVGRIEEAFPDASRFETFASHRSRHTMDLYQRLGYAEFRRERASEQRERVYLQKTRTAR
jgi:ech hydrogenase subunit C